MRYELVCIECRRTLPQELIDRAAVVIVELGSNIAQLTPACVCGCDKFETVEERVESLFDA